MNSDIDIYNFLPKYKNIEFVGDEYYMNPYENKNFNQTIYEKQEFEKLQPFEDKPQTKGDLMIHQVNISRFLSNYTPYDGLLIFHAMGTGKTCSAIGTIEKMRGEIDNTYKKALILARGKGILNNILNELVFVCTDGKYIPEDYDNLNKDTQKIRLKKKVSDFYTFETYYKFSKTLEGMSDKDIVNQFNDTIIVCDEVHNLHLKTKTKELYVNIYKQLHRLFHILENKKILLLSGTPMKDKPEEIAIIMNLILPLESQLPTGMDFVKKFLIYDDDTNIYSVNLKKAKELKKYFKGRVSYLQPVYSENVEKKFIGNYIENLEFFKIFEENMIDIQKESYKDAYKLDYGKQDVNEGGEEEEGSEGEEGTGIYSNSRQASLFVFPDGSYGSKGFKKYVQEVKTGGIQQLMKIKKKGGISYKLTNELINKIKNPDISIQLDNLRKYSVKYASVIENMLKNDNQTFFIYCSFVKGSGIILFTKILELFGFSKANGTETKKGLRYASITSGVTPLKLIQRFNDKDNMYGDYIKVIIGSRVIGEGFSLKNVREVHILTPHWNYAETDQAIARAFRAFSHIDLLESGMDRVDVNIYLHTSLSNSRKKSIDYIMYELSEKKDISIKNIERLLRESAFDCQLNKIRNTFNKVDNSRECDYKDCDYKCDGINLEDYTIDISTYQLYYLNSTKIIEMIKNIFKTHFSVSLSYIKDYTELSYFQLLSVLSKIISKNIPIQNKYGFTSFLREQNNIYFLVNNIIDIDFFNYYYCQYPSIKEKSDFNYLVESRYQNYLPQLIRKIKNGNDIERQDLIVLLPINIQELLIESAIQSESLNVDYGIELRKWLLNYYKSFIRKLGDNLIISSYLKSSEGFLRCYDVKQNIWTNCNEDIEEEVEDINKDKKDTLEQNKYGYYGIIDKGEFSIRDVRNKEALKASDKRIKRQSGKKCKSWDRDHLLHIIYVLNISISEKESQKITSSKKELIKKLNIDQVSRTMSEKYDIDFNDIEINTLKNIFFYSKLSKNDMCKIIRTFFENNNLLLEIV